MLKAEVIRTIDEKIMEDTVSISRGSYPTGWACNNPEEYYSEMLMKEDNIHIMLRDDKKNVGFLFAIPHNSAMQELKDDDGLMGEDPGAYYIENVAILPPYREGGAFGKILAVLHKELKKRGILRISLHARISNNLSRNIQRNMNIIETRRIDEWKYYGYAEPTDYIVAEWSPAKEKM
jgi:ribosomal protein S18 acetylase RimI-like enzyme